MATAAAPAAPRCCAADLRPHLDPARAERVAGLARALADPIRVQLLDVLRAHAGPVCQCDLQPLFGVAQPTLSHHLRKLGAAGLVAVERRGKWAYYSLAPDAEEALATWPS